MGRCLALQSRGPIPACLLGTIPVGEPHVDRRARASLTIGRRVWTTPPACSTLVGNHPVWTAELFCLTSSQSPLASLDRRLSGIEEQAGSKRASEYGCLSRILPIFFLFLGDFRFPLFSLFQTQGRRYVHV